MLNWKDITNDPNWTTIKTPTEILFYCKIQNQQHFGQAYTEGTPFTKEPLRIRFSWNSQTREAQMVVNGTYTPTDETEIQRMFLDHLSRVTPIDKFNEQVSLDDFKQKMKKWRESTSTLSSGRRLGHYKVCVATIDKLLEPKEREKLKRLQTMIANTYVTIINYSTKHKYSFQWWKNIVNMMIHKEFLKIDAKVSKLLGKFGYSKMQAVKKPQASVLIGGAGCPPAYAMASSRYVTHLLKNWRTRTEKIGRTFRIVVARFQQASGTSKPVFEHPSIPLPYITGVICDAIRKYLSI